MQSHCNRGDIMYPADLEVLPDPPKELYFKGNTELLNTRIVSIVGSRKTSAYGIWAAREIAAGLASRGITVLSGLAAGIDKAAHEGALSVSGNTAAVLGCGFDYIYPQSNRELYRKLENTGLLITEYEDSQNPTRYTFPRRNRIISALSEATILVEAGLNSGALLTADISMQLGKPVYAVAANINSEYSLGSNLLLRDGAEPIFSLEDVYQYLGVEEPEVRAKADLGGLEADVYQALGPGGEKSIDLLAQELKMGTAELNGVVTVLEIKGLVFTSLGRVIRK